MVNDTKRSLQVFLCHSSGDKPKVQKLYERLVRDGVDAWLDKEKLIPGQNWKIEIPKAVRNADVVTVCLSSQSVNKEGFIQKEIKIALDTADEKAEGTIFIIPARLENCNVPERISQFHWVDLFSDSGYEWLLKALRLRASTVGATIEPSKNEKTSAKTEIKKQSGKFPQQEQHYLTPSATEFTTTPRLEGTIWEGTESDKTRYIYEFLPKGVLKYTSSSGTFTNGTWYQKDNIIYMETNSKYSERKGVINRDSMTGDGWNTGGTRWTWTAKKR